MHCSTCGRNYELRDFGREETYFECDACAVELHLSPAELKEIRLRGGTIDSDSTAAGAIVGTAARSAAESTAAPVIVGKATRAAASTSLFPLKAWLGCLGIFIVAGVASGVTFIAMGQVFGGGFLLGFYLVLFLPAFVGVMLRRRFGLYLTFAILAFLMVAGVNAFFRVPGSAAQKAGGIFMTLFLEGLFVAWILWFAKHAHLFPKKHESVHLVEDVYSMPRRADESSPDR